MIGIDLRISTKKNSILIPKFYNNQKKLFFPLIHRY